MVRLRLRCGRRLMEEVRMCAVIRGRVVSSTRVVLGFRQKTKNY